MKSKIPVAILGATGTVGQKFILLLQNHPWMEISELVASSNSVGKKFRHACNWKQPEPMPENCADKVVLGAGEKLNSRILFSSIDSSKVAEMESNYAAAGHTVISNSSRHRMDSDVPLIIPEINSDHFEITKAQKFSGALITNSNCVVMPMTMAIAPLMDKYGIEWVQLSSMQAISGAGYPGVPSYDILGNVVPLPSEEPKVEVEGNKILGSLEGNTIKPADFIVSAQCTRVPVVDGHTATLSIKFKKKFASMDEVKDTLRNWKGMPQKRKLPSAPANPIILFEENDRPQPALDSKRSYGMSTCIGRVRECPIGDIKMVILQHNTIRGAAGAAILNAEAWIELGYLN